MKCKLGDHVLNHFWYFLGTAEDGDVFVCGQNHRGQLGMIHNMDILTLQLCSGISQRIVQVACGWDFSLFLTGKELSHD